MGLPFRQPFGTLRVQPFGFSKRPQHGEPNIQAQRAPGSTSISLSLCLWTPQSSQASPVRSSPFVRQVPGYERLLLSSDLLGSDFSRFLERRLKLAWPGETYYPDTPWDCHICRSVGVVWGVNVGIYGSPMEYLGLGCLFFCWLV